MKKELVIVEINNEVPIKEWGKLLMGEWHMEALASIKHEEVTKENVFYFEIEGRKYLGFYVEGEQKPADLSMLVNREHQKVMRDIKIRRINSEMLYSLELGVEGGEGLPATGAAPGDDRVEFGDGRYTT